MSCPDALDIRPPKDGWYHKRRRALQVLTSLFLLLAPFLGVLRVDLGGPRLILLGASFHLGDFAPIFLLLLLGMFVIFAGSLLYGRLWCGWMCPQTTLSEIAGALDRAYLRGKRVTALKKAKAYGGTLALCALVSASLVSYFLPPAELLSPPPVAIACFVFMFLVLAVDLFWLRHNFCRGICPYGVLQGVIQDKATLGVGFGEGLEESCIDDCNNCQGCVRACVMGIDIREQQFTNLCLNCGDCVDAINVSHERRGMDPVVGFSFGRTTSTWPRPLAMVGIRDPQRLLVILGICTVMTLSALKLAGRPALEARFSPRFDLVERTGDQVRNRYTITLSNYSGQEMEVRLTARGAGYEVALEPATQKLPDGKQTQFEGLVSTPEAPDPGVHELTFLVEQVGGEARREVGAKYFVPGKK